MSKFNQLVARGSLGIAALTLAAPAFAQTAAVPPAQRLTLGGVLMNAKPIVQLVFVGLVIALAYAAFVYIRGIMARRGERPAGLSFLAALAAGGPLIGLFGAAYGLLDMSIGIANIRPAPDLTVLAPGFAEAALSVTLGLLAGAVAVIGHRHLTGRSQTLGQSVAPAADEKTPAHLTRAMG